MEEQKPVDPLNDQFNIAGSQTALEVVESSEEAGDAFEIEVPEELIEYYIDDEDGNELGFAVREGDDIVEYFYADDGEEYEVVAVGQEAQAEGMVATQEMLGKVGKLAGSGAKAAGSAIKNVAQDAFGLAQETIEAGKSGGIAAGAGVVGAAAMQTGKSLKEGIPEAAKSMKEGMSKEKISEAVDISGDDLKAVGQELAELAKGGAEIAGEFKGLLDDLNETFDLSGAAKTFNSFKRKKW